MTDSKPSTGAGATPLRIVLSVPVGARLTPRQLPLQLCFENLGDAPLRLLRQFEPVPVFFSFSMVDGQGQAVDIPGAGKADFFQDSLQYADLPPGGTCVTTIDLAALLPRPDAVRPGRYTVSVGYHNQYGQGCFRGRAASAPITVDVGA